MGLVEMFFLIGLIISIVWINFDAPKHEINKFIAILAIIVFIFPIGLIGYIIFTRLCKPNRSEKKN